jgi:hypothetical protein
MVSQSRALTVRSVAASASSLAVGLVLAVVAGLALWVGGHHAGQRAAEQAVHRWHLGQAKRRRQKLRTRVTWIVVLAFLLFALYYKAR